MNENVHHDTEACTRSSHCRRTLAWIEHPHFGQIQALVSSSAPAPRPPLPTHSASGPGMILTRRWACGVNPHSNGELYELGQWSWWVPSDSPVHRSTTLQNAMTSSEERASAESKRQAAALRGHCLGCFVTPSILVGVGRIISEATPSVPSSRFSVRRVSFTGSASPLNPRLRQKTCGVGSRCTFVSSFAKHDSFLDHSMAAKVPPWSGRPQVSYCPVGSNRNRRAPTASGSFKIEIGPLANVTNRHQRRHQRHQRRHAVLACMQDSEARCRLE